MKQIDRIIILISIVYVFIYKIILFNKSNIYIYIINPLVWMILALITYFTLFNKTNKKFLYQKEVKIITFIISLIYIILFYFFGIYKEFNQNPYSTTLSGIFINLFSIMLVILLQEFMRSIFVNLNHKSKYLNYILVFILFFFYEVNFSTLLRLFDSLDNFFNAFIKELIPIISVNLLMIYLSKVSSFKGPFIYRLVVTIPRLTIYIIPNYSLIIELLFNLIPPIFIYLTIKYVISKKGHNIPVRILKEINPKRWLVTFLIIIFLVCFSIGLFPIRPVVILSASMEPTLKQGDLVIIESCDITDIKVGDIVEYKKDNIEIIHRVIEINNYTELELITKGDNNKNKDQKPVKKEDLIGKYKFHLPYLGYPTYILYKLMGNNNSEEINR